MDTRLAGTVKDGEPSLSCESDEGCDYVCKAGAPADESSCEMGTVFDESDVAVAGKGFGLHMGSCTGALPVKGPRHGP